MNERLNDPGTLRVKLLSALNEAEKQKEAAMDVWCARGDKARVGRIEKEVEFLESCERQLRAMLKTLIWRDETEEKSE